MVPKVLCFTPMCKPCLGHEEKNHIDPHLVKMASVAMVHFGLDPGKFIHFLAGKYTGHHWDVCRTLDAVQDYVTPDDYKHMKRILLNGCPAQLTFEEPTSKKLEFISRGNSKSFVDNPHWSRILWTRKTVIATWYHWISSCVNFYHTFVTLPGASSYKKKRMTELYGMVYYHSSIRYHNESGYVSHTRSANNLWSWQNSDLHRHL